MLVDEILSFNEEIEVEKRKEDNSVKYIVKNNNTNKFFVITAAQYLMLLAFDGNRSCNEVCTYLNENKVKISMEALEGLINKFIGYGLLLNGENKIEKDKKIIQLQQGSTLLQKLLYIKIQLVNPDKFLEGILKVISFKNWRLWVGFYIFYNIIGLGVYIKNFMPNHNTLISPSMKTNLLVIIFLYLYFIISSIFHEIGHGILCKRFGGNVTEMGFLIIYFRLGLYCNISDAYLFKRKSQRVLVSLAGILVDIFFWSSFMLVGLFLKNRGFDVYYIYPLALVALVSIALELNPLIKLDGYYFLSELTGVLNLRDISFKYLKDFIKEKVKGEKSTHKVKPLYMVFSLFSLIYSAFLLASVAVVTYKYCIKALGETGQIIFALILMVIIIDILVKAFKGLKKNKSYSKTI